MKITTENYPDFVRNAVVMWRKGYERVPMVAKAFYEVSNNSVLTTEHSSMDGFSFARRVTEGDKFYKANPTQNYLKTIRKYRVALQADITWEMRKYDKYSEMKRVLSGMGESASQRLELDLTHRITFGLATSYVDMDGTTVDTTVGDGLELFKTAHTVKGSATTYSNVIPSNPLFSKAGMEAAEKLFSTQMIDSNGTKIVTRPDTIFCAENPRLENDIRTLLSSMANPDTTDNSTGNSGTYNTYKGKYNLIVLPYLASTADSAYDSTKVEYWGLANLKHTDAILEISENPTFTAPRAGGNGEEFDTENWSFKTTAAYGIGISDPKWITLSTGAGS